MANPLLLDIVTFLTSKGVIQGDGIDTFRDFIPETPNSLKAIMEYGGSPMVNYEPTAHRSVQIIVRDQDADVARQKALEIFKALYEGKDESSKINFTEDRWGQVSFRNPPVRIDIDSSDRVKYGFNLGITTTID